MSAEASDSGALERVVIAMSGGVDSSVVAALAAASGARVIGITLQLYDYGAATGRKGACCAGDAIAAQRHCWLARARPGGLEASLEPLRRVAESASR